MIAYPDQYVHTFQDKELKQQYAHTEYRSKLSSPFRVLQIYFPSKYREVAESSAVRYPTGVKSAEFRSQLEAPCVSNYTDEL